MNKKFFSGLRVPCPELVDAEVERILGETLTRHLIPRDQGVVSAYYGIGMESVTRAILAEKLNLSYEKVGAIRDKALAKLRQPACREPLLTAIDEYVSSLGAPKE